MLASGGEELSPLPFTVSGNTRRAVSSAMSLKKDDRPQDIGDFLSILDGGWSGKPESGQRQSGFSGTSGAQGRPGDSTVLDEKKNDGRHGMGAGNSGSGWGGNGGDVRGREDKGVGEGRPSSSPNPSRAKVWLIAACVIVGLVAGFFLLRNLMSGGDVKDGQIAALQRELQVKDSIAAVKREQRIKDSLAFVQRRQHIKDSVAAAKRAEQEAAAKEEAARKAAEEKARQEAARKAAEEARSTTGTINGHQWVDLGLSVKWATCNVGASSPSDYGNYYAWGETRTKSKYRADNCTTYGVRMGDISGDSRYDAARANWGGTWRLPTQADMQELIDKCTWTWTSQGGHNGYRVTGPNGSSIFLPAAGYRSGSSLGSAGGYGYYWSSTPNESDAGNVYELNFYGSAHGLYWSIRYLGQCVRPVSD